VINQIPSPLIDPSNDFMDLVTRTRPLSVAHRLQNRISNLRLRYGVSLSAFAEVRRERKAGTSLDVPVDDAILPG
jgi:hypothetical protein